MEGQFFPDQEQLLLFLRRLKEVFDVCDDDADGFIRVEHLEDLGLQFGQGDEVRGWPGGRGRWLGNDRQIAPLYAYSVFNKLRSLMSTGIFSNKWWPHKLWKTDTCPRLLNVTGVLEVLALSD